MNNDVKVSVIMPSLNTVRYIKEAIDSVVNQTLKEIELICVDAGSNDGTLEIIEAYRNRDKRVKLIRSDKKSYGYQMNLGIDNSKGEYIGIVEPDDYMDLVAYEELYNKIIKYDVDFIKCDYYEVYTNKDGRVEKEVRKLFSDKNVYNNIIELRKNPKCAEGPIASASGIFKREFLIINHIRYNETEGASYQDNGFMFQCNIFSKSVLFLNRPYYNYRKDNPNSSIHNKGKVDVACNEFRWIFNLMEKNKDYVDLKWVVLYFLRYCYSSYLYTLKRIDDSLRVDFFEIFKNDFYNIINSDIVKIHINNISDSVIEKIDDLLNDFDNYMIKKINSVRQQEHTEDNLFNNVAKNILTARIDTLLCSDNKNTPKCLYSYISDKNAICTNPSWMQNLGCGYVLESSVLSLDVKLKVITEGIINISLKSKDVRKNGRRVPYWINYTKLIINDKENIVKPIPAWHDKPVTYFYSAKAGEIISIHVEWEPLFDTRIVSDSITNDDSKRIKKLEKSNDKLNKKINTLKKTIRIVLN